MRTQKFASLLESHIEALYLLIDEHMLPGGDIEEDSQRLCLINRLNSFGYSINGIEDSDMK
jgi:hypothetical protein